MILHKQNKNQYSFLEQFVHTVKIVCWRDAEGELEGIIESPIPSGF